MKIRIVCLLLIFCLNAAAQLSTLKSNIETLCKTKKATIGVALYDFEKKDTLRINGDKHFPMQSVFKFHIALTLINEVQEGRIFLDKKINIKKEELLPNTWSPLRDDHPNGGEFSLEDILRYMVSQSDNNACDILIRLLGGPSVVDEYIHKIAINGCSIQVNEEEMGKTWDAQFKNWTTPKTTTFLLMLMKAYKTMYTDHNYDLLYNMMISATTGQNRLKKGLPQDAKLAHKTGTSGTNKDGITAAVNDIGIIELANGKEIAISVFVSNSSESMEANEKIIADISKLVAEYFSK